PWANAASSLYMDRNGLGFDSVHPFVIEESVPCLTLPDLLEKYSIHEIDVLQIDAEGHDYHILKQLDFSQHHPCIINFEVVNLPQADQEAAKRLLNDQGYTYRKAGYDLFCVRQESF